MEQITIFTPTYNRRALLNRCYESLEKQTNKNFEWLIVDDGSNDNTNEFVKEIIKIANFKITYLYQKNGGKHRAYNNAIKNCNNKYFLFLDSDDILDEKCIQCLYDKIELIKENDNLSGIIGNRFKIGSGEIIGTPLIPNKIVSGIELYQKFNFKGDTLRLYKTSILKGFLFPEIKGEKFVYENVVFDQIDSKYKMYTINEKLYYCEYQDDGYTSKANILKKNNPIGYALSLKSAAETAVSFRKKISWTILYIIWCRKMSINNIEPFKSKFLYVSLYPFAIIFELIKYPSFFFRIFEGE